MNRRRGVTDQKVSDADGLQVDIDGLKGEFAFAKAINRWPDMQVGQYLKADVETAIGGVDVKTTRYRNGRLLGHQNKTDKITDWYALMWIESENTIHFLGAASGEDLFKDECLTDLGKGMAYALRQEQLISPEKFVEMAG